MKLLSNGLSNGLSSYSNRVDNYEGGGVIESNDHDEDDEQNEHAYEIVQPDITSVVYNPYITNDDNNTNNTNNNISNDVAGNDGGNYNEMNYVTGEENGVCSVSLDN